VFFFQKKKKMKRKIGIIIKCKAGRGLHPLVL